MAIFQKKNSDIFGQIKFYRNGLIQVIVVERGTQDEKEPPVSTLNQLQFVIFVIQKIK